MPTFLMVGKVTQRTVQLDPESHAVWHFTRHVNDCCS